MNRLTSKPIVVPFDFSAMSNDALATAVDLAAGNSKIHVVHVIPQPPSVEPGAIWAADENEALAKEATENFRKGIPQEKYPGISFQVAFGDPGTAIAKFSKDLGAGLVVISSHGRTGLSHFFLGSVAERVTRFSPCPVLVLRS